MVVGILQVELFLPMAQSLKDKRSVLKSLRDQVRHRFNVAVGPTSKVCCAKSQRGSRRAGWPSLSGSMRSMSDP
ncbi:MAG: hypothetical protein COV75_01445 [Candidatus Omnitrophica bacterium CG11_big_fil_rev_8_21_14_0_20_63_9]|nr:MAG: hypothetical protein COV75_01445 [Candidatus Omnitrophica bacterium CG11_big_fil_rev_8_21_14_0_20_63_9]